MSTLQISLAVIGAVLLALIVAYNAWNNRRNTPKRATPQEADRHAEPALRQEPGMEDRFAPDPSLPSPTAHPPEYVHYPDSPLPVEAALHTPSVAEMPEESVVVPQAKPMRQPARPPAAPTAPPPAHDRRLALDPLIDAIALLKAEHPVPGEAVMAAMPPTRRAGSKPFAIEAFNDVTGHWEMPVPGARYRTFQAGVQLANRMGALNQIEFSEFVHKTQAFADAVNAAVDFPDMLSDVGRARELDQFAGEHDAQLGFVLRARLAAWSPGYLQQNAARLGFVPGAIAGRMVLPVPNTPSLPPLLSLAFDTQAALAEDLEQSAIRELTISLDVPQVHRSEMPFARLREIADALCTTMDGVLCDQNSQPLPSMAMDAIAGDLELLYDQLDSRGLSAGSALARRLFS